MNIDIREANSDDMLRGFQQTLSVLSPVNMDPEQIIEYLWERNSRSIKTCVAVLPNGVVVGTISYFIELKFIHNGGKVCHVEDVAVREEYQRKGVGRKMDGYVQKIAAEHGCYKIILDCGEHNIGFYEKCGYRRHETMMRKDL